MVATKSPAFRFYVTDFLMGCRRMTTEQIGVYILLLCEQWDSGIVPNDEAMLQQITKCKKMHVISKALEKFKRTESGDFYNERLEKEREKQSERNDRLRKNGMKGGRPKLIDNQCHEKPDGFVLETKEETKNEPKKKASVSVSVSTYKESIVETDVSSPSLPGKLKGKNKGTKTFFPPTLDEIKAYLKEYTGIWTEAQAYEKAFAIHNHYESNGWHVGKNKMKDWRASVRTWLQRDGFVPFKANNQLSLLQQNKNNENRLPDARDLAQKYQ